MVANEGLVARVAELEANRDFKGLHLVSLFLKRRVQPLQARVAPMWEYSGPFDSTRTHAEVLSNDEFEVRLRAVAALKADATLPSAPPVALFGEGLRPKKVISFDSSYVSMFLNDPQVLEFLNFILGVRGRLPPLPGVTH